MWYLSQFTGYENIGEFLTHPPTIKQIHEKEGLLFSDRYYFTDVDPRSISSIEYPAFMQQDISTKMKLILNYERPVLVKAFVNHPNFRMKPAGLLQLADNMKLVVLRRKNAFKSLLSDQICQRIQTWHITNDDEYNSVKHRLSKLKFEIPEYHFIRTIQDANNLTLIDRSIAEFPDAISLAFEDFSDNPVVKLNGIFGGSVSETPIPIRGFIDNHESHIINLERLKKLYRIFSISQEI